MQKKEQIDQVDHPLFISITGITTPHTTNDLLQTTNDLLHITNNTHFLFEEAGVIGEVFN